MKTGSSVAAAYAVQIFLFISFGLAATPEPPFYQGKALTVVVAEAPGGTGDLRARAVIQHLQKHLSGNPSVVFQYMPGGGGTAAANHLANVVKRDGLTIGQVGTGAYANAIFGAAGVRYRLEDFIFLGSATSGGPYILVLRPAFGLESAEKLKSRQGLRFANRSVGHTMYVLDRIFSFVLDLKEPKWVLGYSGPEIQLALERGEADAQITSLYALLKDTPHWLKSGFGVPVVMRTAKGRGAEVLPEFPQDRPVLDRYADTELKRAILQLHHASRPGGSTLFVSKGIPEPAVRALREAFKKVWSDALFAEDYKRLTGEPADPITGEEIERVLRQIPQDPRITEIYKQLIGGGPLPSGG